MTLWTAGFFVCLELFTNNVLDPHVLGRGAGLTPFGVILSASFWAWLWGAPGLFLAIPLTACLTVVGRYVPQLAFLPALLGHDSVASPAARLYERLAMRDDDEAAALLRHAAKDGDLVELSDALVLPLLAHLFGEREAGRCSRADLVRSLRRLRELLAERIASVPVSPRVGTTRALRLEELGARAEGKRGAWRGEWFDARLVAGLNRSRDRGRDRRPRARRVSRRSRPRSRA